MTEINQTTGTRPETLTVRMATQNDLPLLEAQVKPSLGRTFVQELDDQSQGQHSLFIAINQAQVFGWGFIRWLGPRDAQAFELFPAAPEIYRLEVVEQHRSQGIGRALIEAMIASADARNYPAVSLGVAHDNPRAYGLYQQMGFEDTELREYYDEYDYPLPDGGTGRTRDLCRYLLKPIKP